MGLPPTKDAAAKITGHSFEEFEEIFGQLRALSRQRGYARGWAHFAFVELTEIWPGQVGVTRAAPRDPSPEIREWEGRRWSGFVATIHGAPPLDNT